MLIGRQKQSDSFWKLFDRLAVLRHFGLKRRARVNSGSIHKRLKAELIHLPEPDLSMRYPMLGMMSQFMSKFLSLKDLDFRALADPKNLKELREVLYGVHSSRQKSLSLESVSRIQKRARAPIHKTWDARYIDPCDKQGHSLRVDYFAAENTKTKVPVLIMHGIYSGPIDMVKVISKLTKAGYPVIISSYAGFAPATRSSDASSIVASTKAVLDSTLEQGHNTVDIFAHSLGAAITAKTLASLERNDKCPKINHLVFAAPFDSSPLNTKKIVDRLAENHPSLTEDHKKKLSKLLTWIFKGAWDTPSNIKTAFKKTQPNSFTVISGAKDAVCDREAGDAIVDAASRRLQAQHIHKEDRGHFTMFESEDMPYDEILEALA